MMSKKIAQGSAADQEDRKQPPSVSQAERPLNAPLECRGKLESTQRNGEMASTSPDSDGLNSNGKRGGKMRHRNRKRSSNSESCPEVTPDNKTKNEEQPIKRSGQSRHAHAGLVGLQSECANVWFERSVYERAESLYQCWLVSSSNRTSKSNRSTPAPGKPQKSPSPSSSGPACVHGDQVACHHVVEAAWVNKTTFDQAQDRFVEESLLSVPNSLNLQAKPNCPITPGTPDEGYQSWAPTPATPVTQQPVVPPTNRQPINGLPRVPVELLRDVWLEKPLYDRAEAVFYQNLYGSNSSKRASCAPTSRSSDPPQSLVEEEEEEEEEEVNGVALEEKRVVLQGKADVFHALLPIQEEEEPVEVPETDEASGAAVASFVHPDSEPIWLDKSRYDAAENRFHVYNESKAAAKKGRRPAVALATSTTPLRDKYEQTGEVEALLMFQFDFTALL
ncbi:uncharacterized protein [Antennarius striatus]